MAGSRLSALVPSELSGANAWLFRINTQANTGRAGCCPGGPYGVLTNHEYGACATPTSRLRISRDRRGGEIVTYGIRSCRRPTPARVGALEEMNRDGDDYCVTSDEEMFDGACVGRHRYPTW